MTPQTRNTFWTAIVILIAAAITAVMIERHLVSSVDPMADKDQPQRGGSRNRYLFRTSDGNASSRDGVCVNRDPPPATSAKRSPNCPVGDGENTVRRIS